jgi:ribosomal protein S18 acetylase RimI-like enzyme
VRRIGSSGESGRYDFSNKLVSALPVIKLSPPFRKARPEDAHSIAELIAISSDGVAMIEWTEAAQREPDLQPLEVGACIYRDPEGDYSYRNCIVSEHAGKVSGALLSFAIPPSDPADRAPGPPFDGSDVFAPYKYLEAPNSWYICGVALFPAYRGQGIGTRFMAIAGELAACHGYGQLSLVAFEQNEGSVKLYQRLGYAIVDRAPIVPHPLIHYRGDALLMVKQL